MKNFRKVLYLSVDVFSRKVLFGDTIFTRDRHFTWSSEPRESIALAAYRFKENPHFSVIFWNRTRDLLVRS